MKIFLSFSGARSRRMAEALHEWLPRVLPGAEPFLSDRDTEAGTLWGDSIRQAFQESKAGVICLTRENRERPWLHFEAGALTEHLGDRKVVCPYLLGLEPKEIVATPLNLFQAKRADQAGTRDLVLSLGHSLLEGSGGREREEELERSFETTWPFLRERLDEAAALDPHSPGLSPAQAAELAVGEVELLSLEGFVQAERSLEKGDSVLLFSNNLRYDLRAFVEVIAENLTKGVGYRYLVSAADAAARRNWELLVRKLEERDVPRLPEVRSVPVVPFFWTTAIYEFADQTRSFEAISILEDGDLEAGSDICVRVSPRIAGMMWKKFFEYWHQAEPAP